MGSRKTYLFLSAIFFVVFTSFTNRTSAQHNGSFYFSVGYSEAWFSRAKIHIEQSELGNSYDMLKVPGDNKTKTPISPLQLNYRIGYYYDYFQTRGIELNFDPVNYRIVDGSIVTVKGVVNNANVNKKVAFSKANGYYYMFTGANCLLVNLVRRFGLYKTNSNKLRIDAIAKAGVGPVFPNFVNSLPINPMVDPKLQLGGWNVGAEAGFRVTLCRYAYVELTGKYDHASFNALKIYDGTARQNLNTYEAIALIGFTFPTTKHNPLFRNEHFITILPFYQQAKLLKEGANKRDSEDSTDHNRFKEIPPFVDILDKEEQEEGVRYKRLHPEDTFNNADSIAVVDSIARVDSITRVDSIFRQDSTDRVLDSLNSKKEKKRRKQMAKDSITNAARMLQDSLNNEQRILDSVNNAQQAAQDSVNKSAEQPQLNKGSAEPPPPPQDTSANKPPTPDEPEKLSKKDEKRREKEAKKEAKRKEKEAEEKVKEEAAAKKKAEEEEAAKKKAEEEEAAQKKADQEKEDKDKEDKKEGQ